MRGILSALLEALGRPIGHGCWVDPMMRGRGNASGGVDVECLPEHRNPAQLGTTVVGKVGVSAPRHPHVDHRRPTGVIVEPSTSETFAPRELAYAYKKFMEHGSQYLDAEGGIEVSVYRFGMRVLVVYEEPGAGLVVFTHPIS